MACNGGSDGFRIDHVRIRITSSGEFVAVWRGKLIGTLCLRRLVERDWSVFMVEVLPQFRRKGVATRLYDEAEALLRSEGYDLVPTPWPVVEQRRLGVLVQP